MLRCRDGGVYITCCVVLGFREEDINVLCWGSGNGRFLCEGKGLGECALFVLCGDAGLGKLRFLLLCWI